MSTTDNPRHGKAPVIRDQLASARRLSNPNSPRGLSFAGGGHPSLKKDTTLA